MRNLKLFLLFASFILISCKKTALTEPKNAPPVISKIVVNPENPKINQVIKITSFATDDDKHELYYRWSVSKGSLTKNGIGNPIYWSTPSTPGNVTIVSLVNDGIDLSTKSIGVDVNDD